MKYVVMDERKDETGDIFTTECNSLEEAIQEAKKQWSYLTYSERKVRRIYVLESANPDEDAEDHLDGDVVWEAE